MVDSARHSARTWLLASVVIALGGCRTSAPAGGSDPADDNATRAARVPAAASASLGPAASIAPDAETSAPLAAGDAGGASCDPTKTNPQLHEVACETHSFEGQERPIGLSLSGAYFGYCVSPCDPCGFDCDFIEVATRRRLHPRTGGEYRGEPGHKSSAAEDAAWALVSKEYPSHRAKPAIRHFSSPFPYEEDIVFVTKTEPTDANGKETLLFGARVAGEEPVYPFRMTLGPHSMWNYEPKVDAKLTRAARREAIDAERKAIRSGAHVGEPFLAAIDVLAGGKDFAAVAFAHGDRFFEAGDMIYMPTAVLVGRLYNESGLAAHAAKRYSVAARLFAKAGLAQPSESLFAYNEACARARAAEPEAEAALERAIRLGGPAIRARAKKDPDFEGARTAPWFVALVK